VIIKFEQIVPTKWVANGLLALCIGHWDTMNGRTGELNRAPEKPVNACVKFTPVEIASWLVDRGVVHEITDAPLHLPPNTRKTKSARVRGVNNAGVPDICPPLGRTAPSEMHNPADAVPPQYLLPDMVISLVASEGTLPALAASYQAS
jgi:hypothetical protein